MSVENTEQKTSIGENGRPVAAITGASSGFGKIYAERLAAEGNDLLLVARRENLLNEIAAELRAKFGVAVEIIVADLSDLTDVERVEKRLEALSTLRYLINNAGFGGNQKFPDVFVDVETKMIQTHCLAPMRLCRAALVPMKERAQKSKKRTQNGFIINVSSVSGFLAGEGAADYTATKAFLITFSRSLQCDVAPLGVRIQALCPGFARTGFHDAETMRFSDLKQTVPRFMWQRADRVVDASLRALRRPFFYKVAIVPTALYKIAAFFGSGWVFAPLRILFSGGKIR